MNKEFLRNILFVISINLLIKPAYILGVDRTVQNLVGPEVYGVYFALFNLTWVLQIINDFGLQNYNNRAISQGPYLAGKYLPKLLGIKIWLAALYALTTIGLAGVLGYESSVFPVLLLLMLNQVLISLVFFLRSTISGLGLYRVDSYLSGADKLLMVIIVGVILLNPPTRASFRIEWFVYGQTLSYVLTAAIAIYILRKYCIDWKPWVNKAEVIVILRKSFPFALIILLMTAYTRIDGIMLERMLGDEGREAGIYGSAYRLLDAANMIGYLFAGLLLPMFSRLLKDRLSVSPLVNLGFRLIWPGSIIFATTIYFFRVEIMELLYTAADSYWGNVLGVLMFSFIAGSVSYVFGTLLTANGSLRKLNYYFLAGFFINLILNLLFIPLYKAEGAAMATVITQFLVMIAQVYQAQVSFPGLLKRLSILQAIIMGLFIFAVVYFVYNYLTMWWPNRLLISFLVGGVIPILFGWWRIQDLKMMIQMQK